MEASIAELVASAGDEPPVGCRDSGNRHMDGLTTARSFSTTWEAQRCSRGEEAGVRQPQWIEEQGLDEILIRLARHCGEQVPRQNHSGIVVREHRAGGCELRDLLHARHVSRECALAPSQVCKVIAHPACAVVEELPNRSTPNPFLQPLSE
jgi:hypothetical protein